MEWPNINIFTGEYSTVDTCKTIWRRALEACLADITLDHTRITPKVKSLKERILRMDGDENPETWQNEFRSIVEEFTNIMAEASPEQALDMCQAGLDASHDQLLYRIDDQTIVPAKDVFVLSSSFEKLKTEVIKGSKPLKADGTCGDTPFPFGLANPQNPNNEMLYGLDACAQIDAWYKYGLMETSAAVLAKTSLTTPNVKPLIHNKIFCLLGVTSELGPAKSLLKLPGVTVLGIGRNTQKLKELKEYVIYNSPENTRLVLIQGGADLLHQGPQIASWILDQTKPPPEPQPEPVPEPEPEPEPTEMEGKVDGEDGENPKPKPPAPPRSTTTLIQPKKELILMPLASAAEGEENVRVCVAMDLIIQRIIRQRDGMRLGKTHLVQYTSPATCMVLPPTASSTAQRRLSERPSWESWASSLTGGRWLQPNLPNVISSVNNNDYTVVNGIIKSQGHHYILAKTIQSWRAMTCYYRDNMIVATPFAPLTRTKGMIASNPSMKAVLDGMHHFEPMLAFDVNPASTLMCNIMISQLQILNRPLPDMDENPFTILWDGAVHGGIWTCPYSLDSISTINWVLGKTYYSSGYIPEGALPPPKEETKNEEHLNEDGTLKTAEEIAAIAKAKEDKLFEELEDSQYGKPMPDCVRERLEFM